MSIGKRLTKLIADAEQSGVALSRRDWLIQAVLERRRADASEAWAAELEKKIAEYRRHLDDSIAIGEARHGEDDRPERRQFP